VFGKTGLGIAPGLIASDLRAQHTVSFVPGVSKVQPMGTFHKAHGFVWFEIVLHMARQGQTDGGFCLLRLCPMLVDVL